jgi:hypothetical protein
MTSIIHTPLFLKNADELFHIILQKTHWTKINYFKRHVSHYLYNIHELNVILLDIEKQLSRKVTGAFLNYYEDGNEYHADKYDCNTCLLSFGTMRTLRYKENTTKENIDRSNVFILFFAYTLYFSFLTKRIKNIQTILGLHLVGTWLALGWHHFVVNAGPFSHTLYHLPTVLLFIHMIPYFFSLFASRNE